MKSYKSYSLSCSSTDKSSAPSKRGRANTQTVLFTEVTCKRDDAGQMGFKMDPDTLVVHDVYDDKLLERGVTPGCKLIEVDGKKVTGFESYKKAAEGKKRLRFVFEDRDGWRNSNDINDNLGEWAELVKDKFDGWKPGQNKFQALHRGNSRLAKPSVVKKTTIKIKGADDNFTADDLRRILNEKVVWNKQAPANRQVGFVVDVFARGAKLRGSAKACMLEVRLGNYHVASDWAQSSRQPRWDMYLGPFGAHPSLSQCVQVRLIGMGREGYGKTLDTLEIPLRKLHQKGCFVKREFTMDRGNAKVQLQVELKMPQTMQRLQRVYNQGPSNMVWS